MRALPMLATFPKPRWRIESVRVSTLSLWLGGLSLVALALRLTWAFYTDTIPLGGDPRWYYVVGINLARGFGFVTSYDRYFLEVPGPGSPTAFWPPGYSFALAGVFKLFGVGWTSAKIFNAVLGALTVPLIYGLGSAIFNRRVGLLAAGVFALWPNAIAWVPLLFPEQLFTLLLLAALWLLVASPPTWRNHWLALLGFGLFTGLAMLTRGQGVVLIPVAAVYWLGRAGWRPALRSTAISALVAAAVITPWTIRNAVALHAFIPISTNTGAALRVGHGPESIGTTKWSHDRIDGFYMWESTRRPDWEVQGYREYTRLAVEYALTHPKRELELTGLKIYHLYRSDADVIPWLTTLDLTPLEPRGLENALRHLFDYAYYAVLFAAVLSTPLWLRRDPERLLLVSVVLFWTIFHVVFLGEPRYHVPLYPVFAIGTAAGVWGATTVLIAAMQRWRWRRPTIAAPLPQAAVVAQGAPQDAETSA